MEGIEEHSWKVDISHFYSALLEGKQQIENIAVVGRPYRMFRYQYRSIIEESGIKRREKLIHKSVFMLAE